MTYRNKYCIVNNVKKHS